MFTKESNIDLSSLRPITNSKISGTNPLVAEINNEKLILELASQDKGFEWTDNQYIILDCKTDINSRANLKIEFYEGQNMLWAGYFLVPNRRVKMAVKLDELESKRFFLPTYPGNLKGHVVGIPTHISKIDRIRVVLEKGRDGKTFTLYSMYLSDTLPDFTVVGEPLVDEMGQSLDMDWEGKTKSVNDLIMFLKDELKKAEEDYNYINESWSKYGGWKEKKFDETGFFHTHNDGNRWWLVDPDGYAFYSNGVCYGSRMGEYGFVDKMESLFKWLPPKDDAMFKDAWTTADNIPEFVKRNSIEVGKNRYVFNFARANMIRAFGKNWWDAWVKINTNRLKQWGFNTISVCVNNYLDENVMEYLEKAKIPFTWTLKEFPKTEHSIFRDFPDVFDPEYEKRSKIFAQQLKPFIKNPYMIGYFINNEPEWLVQHDVNLSERILANKHKLYSKIELVKFLSERYSNEIEKLNTSWNCKFISFDDLYIPMENADRLSKQSEKDLLEFRDILIEQYAVIPVNALRDIDPNHLNLGMRYATITEEDFSGDKLYDVFSFNRYGHQPTRLLDIAHNKTAKPVIIGEWHIGGSDKGLFSNGLVCALNQTERGKACANYMQTAMADTQCIGLHYFEFNDQPLLGRFDGECSQHGMIDVCNKPYYEFIKQIQEVNSIMYQIVNGDVLPVMKDAIYVDSY